MGTIRAKGLVLLSQLSESSPQFESPDLVASLGELARTLRTARRSTPDTLETILRSSLTLIDGADSGAIATLGKDGSRTVVASTDALSGDLCREQFEMGQGPIVSEVRHFTVVVSADLDKESRWPKFAVTAVDAGIRSLAAFQLYSSHEQVGALVLYSTRVDAFDDDVVSIGEALAAHAAVALLYAQDTENFQNGLATRDIIGQAKGMLMERYDIDAVQAFELLAKLSQQENRRLHLVCRQLVDADHPTRSVES
ncbi:transcriptional regulator [Rhodococcoides trifolii]|uniref:Transcriptional regulator n=1 Tax=Rhodococcoides trifolii TaxID=908250 RepID=A0A917LG08_9NOCA|nr:transcriptional regulator [Rhodococcus trifolii]